MAGEPGHERFARRRVAGSSNAQARRKVRLDLPQSRPEAPEKRISPIAESRSMPTRSLQIVLGPVTRTL
jgi:hypothetical protein